MADYLDENLQKNETVKLRVNATHKKVIPDIVGGVLIIILIMVLIVFSAKATALRRAFPKPPAADGMHQYGSLYDDMVDSYEKFGLSRSEANKEIIDGMKNYDNNMVISCALLLYGDGVSGEAIRSAVQKAYSVYKTTYTIELVIYIGLIAVIVGYTACRLANAKLTVLAITDKRIVGRSGVLIKKKINIPFGKLEYVKTKTPFGLIPAASSKRNNYKNLLIKVKGNDKPIKLKGISDADNFKSMAEEILRAEAGNNAPAAAKP